MIEEWLGWLFQRVGDHPLLQGLVAAAATLILEDPTTIGCGLLVADGKMAFSTAFIGVSMGIALGDLGLYGAGRWFGPRVMRLGLVSEARLETARTWFENNLVAAVVLSRFIPGMRLPTYVGAGVFSAPVGKFLLVAVGASVVWTFGLLHLTVYLGEAVLPILGRWKWPVAGLALATLIVLQWLAGRRRQATPAKEPLPAPTVHSSFEFWPPGLFYLPVVGYYLWLALRYRSLTLPTAVNPSIFSGGFIGESKSAILSLVAPSCRSWVAPFVTLQKPAGGDLDALLTQARVRLSHAGLELPVVAKPDLGQRGDGVQVIRKEEQLARYLEGFPAGQTMILQQLVDWPGEAGILYYRLPDAEKGTIFSVTLKEFPALVGDGVHSLRDLILRDARARIIADIYLKRHHDQQNRVLESGEVFPLVFAGNHCQGAIFRDGAGIMTPALKDRIEALGQSIPDFYFGRFDLRFSSPEELRRGEGFCVIEINGAGAEATHIWDPDTRLFDAYRTLFEQFAILFTIGDQNRSRGRQPLGVRRLLGAAWHYRRLSADYPPTS